mmetsp:Transcript_11509/g.11528  ORF Transcript_11509/g.11528 Transcript_11509/m.11528 type:complete len:166 (-) Transcript_11509:236-733(-)
MSAPFSRKQQWRRQKHVNRFDVAQDWLYEQNGDDNFYSEFARAYSESCISKCGNVNMESNGFRREWNTTGDLLTSKTPISGNKSSRKLRFCNTVNAILIPSRRDYSKLDLKSSLWWSNTDYEEFQSSANYDLKRILEERSDLTEKEALIKLYQPQTNAITSCDSS